MLAPSGRINPSSLCCKLAGELKLRGNIQMFIMWDIRASSSFSALLFYFGKYEGNKVATSSTREQERTLKHRAMMD